MSHLFTRAFCLTILCAATALAQGTMRRPTPESTTRDSNGNLKADDPNPKPNQRVHGVVVVSPDGSAPGQLVEIMATCPGFQRFMATADSKGKFSFSFDPNRLLDNKLLDGCLLYAALEGYRSETLQLAEIIGKSGEKLGTLTLQPIASNPAGLISSADQQTTGGQRKTFEKALDKAAKQDIRGAITGLQELVTADPAYSSAWLTLGILQQLQGDRTGAEKSFLQSAKADIHFALPLIRAAAIEALEGNMPAVLSHSQSAIDLNPAAFPNAYALNAIANIAVPNPAAAEKSARAGLSLDTTHQYPELEYALGVVLYSKDDRKGAAEHLQKYIEQAPNGPNAAVAKNQLAQMQQADGAVTRTTAAATDQDAGPTQALLSNRALPPARNSIKDSNVPLLAKISAYTCLESVSSVKVDPRGHLIEPDSKRVDVAVSDGKEIYGVADGKHFSNGPARDLLGYGFSTTGLFSSIARAVVAGDQLAIEPAGEFLLAREPVIRYNFHALPSTAGWLVSYGKESGSAKPEGWFLLNTKTLLLRRVFVKAAEIPGNLKLTNLGALIDYEPETIAGTLALLPSTARVEVGERSGFKRVSVMSFDHCHAFTADSALTFSDTDSQSENKSASERVRLPVGVELAVSLSASVSTAGAAANDRLTATVVKPLRANGHELIASGAVIEGHVRPRRGEDAVIIEFDRIQTRLGWAPFYAQLVSIGGSTQAHIREANSERQTAQTLRAGSDYAELAEPEIPGVATVIFNVKTAELPAGTQMIWKTESLLEAKKEALVPQMGTPMQMK